MTLYDAPRSNLTPVWTDTRIITLKALVNAGLTARQISDQMGTTRGAVIGKVHRLGIALKTMPTNGKPRTPRAAPGRSLPRAKLEKRLRISMGGGGESRGFMVDVEAVDLPPDTSEFACTIVELGADMCRWPLSDPSADMTYCGAPSVGSWCPRHRRIVFTKPERG